MSTSTKNHLSSCHKQEIEEKLKSIFLRVLELETLREDLSINDVDLWDSTGHINLMLEIEQEFNIQLSPDEIISLSSLPLIRAYLENLYGQKILPGSFKEL